MLCYLSIGCSTGNRSSGFAFITETHLLFNPEWTQIPSLSFARVDWPVALVYRQTEESVEYRETLHDQQRQHGRSRDQFTRSFYSVRRGKARR